MKTVLGEYAPSNAIIRNWVNKLKRGRNSTGDSERLGRPKEGKTQEPVEKAYEIIMNDRRIKLCEIADIENILSECVHIIQEELHIKELLARRYRVC